MRSERKIKNKMIELGKMGKRTLAGSMEIKIVKYMTKGQKTGKKGREQ
jgi:hypothetical protein